MRLELAAIIACGTAAGGGAAMAEEIILAHGENPGNPRYEAAQLWADTFTECTGGEYTVLVASSATLGDDAETLTSASAGVIQVTASSQGATSQMVPEMGLLGLPFLFQDLPTAWEVLDGEIGALLDKRAEDANLKILGMWDNGIRHVTHLSKTVPEPADIRGMKVRTPPDGMTVAIFEAVGAAPAPLAFSELPTALQSGVFDGQENPLTNIYSARLHEITPYITLTGHQYQAAPLLANLTWWNELDEPIRSCVTEASSIATSEQRRLSLEGDQTLQAKMEAEGITFAQSNREAYIEATAPVYDRYAQQFPEFVAALREAVGR